MRTIRACPPPDLAAECGSAGIDAVATRALVAGARANGTGLVEAPGLAKLNEALLADVETMIEAVSAGDAAFGAAAERRFAAIAAGLDPQQRAHLGGRHRQAAFRSARPTACIVS